MKALRAAKFASGPVGFCPGELQEQHGLLVDQHRRVAVRVDLLAVEPHADPDAQVLPRPDQVLGIETPVGPRGANVRGLRHGGTGEEEQHRLGYDELAERIGVALRPEDRAERVLPPLEETEVALVLGKEPDLELVAHAPQAAAEHLGLAAHGQPLAAVVEGAVVRARGLTGVEVDAVGGFQERVADGAVVGDSSGGGQDAGVQILPGDLAFDQDLGRERRRPGQRVNVAGSLAPLGRLGRSGRAHPEVGDVARVGLKLVGQLVARRDLPGELVGVDSLVVGLHGDAVGDVDRDLTLDLLVGEPEPQLVLDHRPRDLDRRLVPVEVGLGQVGVVARAVAVETARAVVELEDALELVASLFLDDSGEAALRPAELDARTRGDHLHLLDGVRVDLAHLLARERIDVGHAGDDRFEVAVARTVHVRIAVAVGILHSGRQREHILVEAARHGQILHELVGETGRLRGLFQVDDVACGDHPHALLDLVRELHVEALVATEQDVDAGETSRAEAGEGDLDDVATARAQHRKLGHAVPVAGHGRLLDVAQLVADRHGRAGQRQPAGVGNLHGQAAGLGRRDRRREAHHDDGQGCPQPSHLVRILRGVRVTECTATPGPVLYDESRRAGG